MNRSILSDTATTFTISPMKTENVTDLAMEKNKKFKKSLVGLAAPECSKHTDLDWLTEILKNKLTISSTQEKIKMLTLTSKSWSIAKKCSEFNVSKYLAKRARKLNSSKGVLAEPDKKKGNLSRDEIKGFGNI